MPRPVREFLVGRTHHVWFRGNNRRRLFSYPNDYAFFMRQLARALEPGSVALHAWSLLPNHGHLALNPEELDSIPRLMQRLCQRYAQYRNKRCGGSGKLFEQRYGSRPTRTLAAEGIVLAYVENNGPRAGVAPEPSAHRWCSHRLKVEPSFDSPYRSLWTPSAFWESLGERPAAYAEWVHARRQLAEAVRDASREREPARRPDGSRTL